MTEQPKHQRWTEQLNLLQKLDTQLFARINTMPHPHWLDLVMNGVTMVMNRGDGWIFGLLVASYWDEAHGHTLTPRIMRRVAPVLWLTTATVEFPLKAIFRRKRPYAQIAEAIVVGAPAQRHSFPSGHAASAFGGAWLLGTYYPRLRPLFYCIALIVAFCRVYVGAHYPSDVVAGAISGVTLAAGYQRLLYPQRTSRRRQSRTAASFKIEK